jgi:hypothetical protein
VHLVDGLEDVTFRYRQLVDLHCTGDETSICGFTRETSTVKWRPPIGSLNGR